MTHDPLDDGGRSPNRPSGAAPGRGGSQTRPLPTRPSGADRLKATIRRLRVSASPPPHVSAPPLRPEPTNAFEIAIAQRLKDLEEEIDRLRTQLNWLLLFIVAAALTNVVISILR